jgi:hypothetical protein
MLNLPGVIKDTARTKMKKTAAVNEYIDLTSLHRRNRAGDSSLAPSFDIYYYQENWQSSITPNQRGI